MSYYSIFMLCYWFVAIYQLIDCLMEFTYNRERYDSELDKLPTELIPGVILFVSLLSSIFWLPVWIWWLIWGRKGE